MKKSLATVLLVLMVAVGAAWGDDIITPGKKMPKPTEISWFNQLVSTWNYFLGYYF
ncbi:MAG TPA: hypothetical protein VJ044_08960 [Candidatus Hodarchaeales archaeon]|nr:hypothetical protein [Candidatus Hodarchaeales archaeon]